MWHHTIRPMSQQHITPFKLELFDIMAVNLFRLCKFEDHEIVDANNIVVGHIRVKPSGIMWSPRNVQDWYGILLFEFVAHGANCVAF